MNGKKRIILLGSTGSIGRSTLDVVARHQDRFQVEALVANRSVKPLWHQIKKFKPKQVALADPEAAEYIRTKVKTLSQKPEVRAGLEGIRQTVKMPKAELVLSAMVGSVGLLPTLDAIRSGKDIALANKETLVMAGDIVMAAVRRHKVKLLPVDSEHAALAQCLHGHGTVPVRRLILTASGGPFARLTKTQLRHATPKQALRHPTWSMGPKITIDSATLMNKGLEVIEAHHLFGVPYQKIEVTVHPQSLVHSLVEYVDGSCLAQMSNPDMRLPIQTALTEPERIGHIIHPLDFRKGMNLTFQPPDTQRFPCLGLAYQAGKRGGAAPAVVNAANEIAVQAFLDHRLDFLGIPRTIAAVLKRFSGKKNPGLTEIMQADQWAREAAKEVVACNS